MYEIAYINPKEDRHHIKTELGVASCGHMMPEPGSNKTHSVNRKNGLPDHQLIYVHKGQGLYQIGGKSRCLSAGSLIHYRPGEPQIYHYSDEDEPEVYWIHFGGSRAEELLQELGFNQAVFHLYSSGRFIEAAERLIREGSRGRPHFSLACNALLMELLVEAARGSEKAPRERTLLSAARETIRENYTRRLPNEELARQCGLSISRFEHLFKECFGMAPQQYKLHLQIRLAGELLMGTEDPIGEIAERTGFSDPLYFSRIFKQKTGYSPKAFRYK